MAIIDDQRVKGDGPIEGMTNIQLEGGGSTAYERWIARVNRTICAKMFEVVEEYTKRPTQDRRHVYPIATGENLPKLPTVTNPSSRSGYTRGLTPRSLL